MNEETPDTLLAYCRENNRVCPQPSLWHALWKMLPAKQRVGAGREPSLPLILAAWEHSSNLQKMIRLADQIQWASAHGYLNETSTFLRKLTETDWHHLND